MKYNIRLTINTQRAKNGRASLRFYVSGYSQHDYIATGLYWKVENFDSNQGIIIRGDAELTEYTNTLEKISGLQKKIKHILDKQPVFSIHQLKISLKQGYSPETDFHRYASLKALKRLQIKEISADTYNTQIDSLNVLKSFAPFLQFQSINQAFLESYKTYLIIEKKYERNTVWARLKDFRTYLNQAKKDEIDFNYPFGKGFKMPKVEPKIEYLYENEFQAIKAHYSSNEVTKAEKTVLRAFLFACYTALRISDIQSIYGKNIKNNLIEFRPHKNAESETKAIKTLRIPLHDFAKELIVNRKKNELLFFDLPSEQKINERLKLIAEKLKIEKEITFHYSRHTFATRFLAAGGSIEILQEILGHEDIHTTMIYVHVEPSRKAKQITLLT